MAGKGVDSLIEERIAQLDSAVSEVFERMLERSCAPVDAEVAVDQRITARIQFSGAITGECMVYASQTVAQVTAEALMGTVSEPCDPMVADAVGELCNMIAGGWKSKLESAEAACLISVPAVTRESVLESGDESGTSCRRSYSFQGNVFEVVLAFE